MSKKKAVKATKAVSKNADAIVEVSSEDQIGVSSSPADTDAEYVVRLSVQVDELQRTVPGGFRPPRHGV